jgi:polyphosphate kinase 2 (PPK2 family)
MFTLQFNRWRSRNPIRPKESEHAYIQRYLATLPRGDKIICRDYRGGNRVVDRRIWNKLTPAAQGQWIERIRAEQHA